MEKLSGTVSLPVVLVVVALMVSSGEGYPHTGLLRVNIDCLKTPMMILAEREYSEEHGPK